MIWPILEARAEIQKYFRLFFGSNENSKICFRDLLTFRLDSMNLLFALGLSLLWYYVLTKT